MTSQPLTETGRFAPSTTGPAHPGTLLAALLCWLDARSRHARIVLRLEDLDPDRCRPEYASRMREDLQWVGLGFDEVTRQSGARERYEQALDNLAARGLLYPCACTRSEIRKQGLATPDGGIRYPGTCRERPLPPSGWRGCELPLRVALPPGEIELQDESGLLLCQNPAEEMGDPVVRRRDGAIAYHLAGVVDDAAAGVTRVVRGRDLAITTATQVSLQRALSLPMPTYRHHLLLLEKRGEKLAKLHGAVGMEQLRAHYSAEALCGLLAFCAGLSENPEPTTPEALLVDFHWDAVSREDKVLHWTGSALELLP